MNFKEFWKRQRSQPNQVEDIMQDGYKIRLVTEPSGSITAMFLGRVQADGRHTSVQFYGPGKDQAIRKLMNWLRQNKVEPERDADSHR